MILASGCVPLPEVARAQLRSGLESGSRYGGYSGYHCLRFG